MSRPLPAARRSERLARSATRTIGRRGSIRQEAGLSEHSRPLTCYVGEQFFGQRLLDLDLSHVERDRQELQPQGVAVSRKARRNAAEEETRPLGGFAERGRA